ncbi:MAG: VCBS repeat-containing protein [Calditrichaeota bacterium]|nr:VCBS repeat-containing protein [Calditrichota bacterium]MCB9369013.1 VCBS repeat-containing protein [Calditrichota bacterium]
MAAAFLSLIVVLSVTFSADAQSYSRVTESPVANDGGSSAAVCFVDIDNDGDLDLFITNDEAVQGNLLYTNDGAGNFSSVEDDPILETGGHNVGATWADFDHDGDVDCFVARWSNQSNRLYINNGDGTFESGVVPPVTSSRGYSETGSWADYDNDGWVDLFVSNSAGTNHHNWLYHNNGDGTFALADIPAFALDGDDSRSVQWCDVDGNGWTDLFVANENLDNDALYLNFGDGIFSSVEGEPPVNDGATNFTASWGDIDNDGDFDLFVGGYNSPSRLYRKLESGFELITESPVIEDNRFAVGSAFADYDNDGDLDLLVCNGFAPSNNTYRHNYLYDNDGAGNFRRATEEPIEADSGWGFGCAFADIDNDQDLDLSIARSRNANEDNLLYRNNQTEYYGVVFRLRGTDSNWSGIGCRVEVRTFVDDFFQSQFRMVEGQSGYCGQTQDVHFGLGAATEIDSVIVYWPSGVRQVYGWRLPANTTYTLIENGGIVSADERKTPVAADHLVITSYPNPFNSQVTLETNLPARDKTRFQVFNTLGQEVTTLHSGVAGPGVLKINWQPTALSSGSYIVTVTQGAVSESQTIHFIK